MASIETRELLTRAGLRPPRTLTLAVTGTCNLQCLHCWVESGVTTSAGHVPEGTLFRLIDEFVALEGEGIRLTGGEPLCHPAWLEVMQFARSAGLKGVSLQTNGMLLTDDHVAALSKLDFPGLSIQISLDGATEQNHDLVRGQGAFKSVLEGMQRLIQGGLAKRITIFFTEMRHNLEDIPAVMELAAEKGIASVVTGTLVRGGRAAEGALVAPPGPDQYLRLLQRYETDPGFRALYEKIGRVAALEWRSNDTPRSECCTFVENPYLTPDGRLHPCVLCHADEYAVSGVFEKGLGAAFVEGAPLWSSLLRVSSQRAAALPQCLDCPGRSACSGGCMGRAWGSCGDLHAADDRCDLRKTVYRQQTGNGNHS